MECVIAYDLFLNETANYAHVFLPGSTFLEKDGTFTSSERRISPVREAMNPKSGDADWVVTQMLANAMGSGSTARQITALIRGMKCGKKRKDGRGSDAVGPGSRAPNQGLRSSSFLGLWRRR